MKAHYMGSSALGRTKKEAYATLHNVRYTGDTKNWTFETYTNAHTALYALLSDHGETVPESKKVRDFMLNMETLDGRLLAGIAAVEANETMMNDFLMASNFLANFIPRNAPVAMACQIAVIESSEGSKGVRGSGKKQGGRWGPRGKGANKGHPGYLFTTGHTQTVSGGSSLRTKLMLRANSEVFPLFLRIPQHWTMIQPWEMGSMGEISSLQSRAASEPNIPTAPSPCFALRLAVTRMFRSC
jgi:hypothetical protein